MTEFDDVLEKIKEWKDQTSEILLELAEEVPNLDVNSDIKYQKLSGQNEVYQYFLIRAVGGKFKLHTYGPALMDPKEEDKMDDGTIVVAPLWSDTSSMVDWFRNHSEKFFSDWSKRVIDNFSSIAGEVLILRQLGIKAGIDRMSTLIAVMLTETREKDLAGSAKMKELDDIAQRNKKELDEELPQLTKSEKIKKKTDAVYDSLEEQAEALGTPEYSGAAAATGGEFNYPQDPDVDDGSHEYDDADNAAQNDEDPDRIDDDDELYGDSADDIREERARNYEMHKIEKSQKEDEENKSKPAAIICPICGLDKKLTKIDLEQLPGIDVEDFCPTCRLDKKRF